MISAHSQDVTDRAKDLYANLLREKLETEHPNKYVAIEPDSCDYFIGSSYSEAVLQAREKHPTRITFVLRIGHEAAIHLGGLTK